MDGVLTGLLVEDDVAEKYPSDEDKVDVSEDSIVQSVLLKGLNIGGEDGVVYQVTYKPGRK